MLTLSVAILASSVARLILSVQEQFSPRVYRNLDEIFAGEYEGMRYEDIKRLRPDEASLRAMDKIGYRYP